MEERSEDNTPENWEELPASLSLSADDVELSSENRGIVEGVIQYLECYDLHGCACRMRPGGEHVSGSCEQQIECLQLNYSLQATELIRRRRSTDLLVEEAKKAKKARKIKKAEDKFDKCVRTCVKVAKRCLDVEAGSSQTRPHWTCEKVYQLYRSLFLTPGHPCRIGQPMLQQRNLLRVPCCLVEQEEHEPGEAAEPSDGMAMRCESPHCDEPLRLALLHEPAVAALVEETSGEFKSAEEVANLLMAIVERRGRREDVFAAQFEELYHWHNGDMLVESSESSRIGPKDAHALQKWSVALQCKPPRSEGVPFIAQDLFTYLVTSKSGGSNGGHEQGEQGKCLDESVKQFLSRTRKDQRRKLLKMIELRKVHELASVLPAFFRALLQKVADERDDSGGIDLHSERGRGDLVLLRTVLEDLVRATFLPRRCLEVESSLLQQVLPPERGAWIEFHLEHNSDSIVRDMEPRAYASVEFVPDGWQLDLLRCIDERKSERKSALVVAPTSSGKSFASYHTITSCMSTASHSQGRGSEEFRLEATCVFVAPTKALVAQMEATVYHFSKKAGYPAVLTSDYRHSLETGKVLITTPQMLAMLLLSPACMSWRRGLQYVVLDEIHCMHDSADLQHAYHVIMAAIPCPVIALSATVENPDRLRRWMQSFKADPVEYFGEDTHPRLALRWNDLRVNRLRFGAPAGQSIRAVHRMSLLRADDPPEAITSMGQLCPHEVLSLYRALRDVCDESQKKSLLGPSAFLRQGEGPLRVERFDCLQYQQHLMRIYSSLSETAKASALRRLRNEHEAIPSAGEIRDPYKDVNDEEQFREFSEHALEACRNLKQRDMLPGLVYFSSRDGCELLAKNITMSLARGDQHAFDAAEATRRMKERNRPRREADGDDDDDDERDVYAEDFGLLKRQSKEQIEADTALIIEMLKHPKIDDTLIVGKQRATGYNDLEYWIERIVRKEQWKYSHPLLQALARGVGVYHAQLPKAYRDTVQVLFRASRLSVVICTKALGLGVNLPARSVVFLAPHKHFSRLEFLQVSGRAGRRGFDVVGHSVFSSLFSDDDIRRLIFELKDRNDEENAIPAAAAPATAVTVDVVLQLLSLLQSDAKEEALDMYRGICHPPLDCHCPQLHHERVRAQTFASIEYLARARLVDVRCARPIGLAGMVLHCQEAYPQTHFLSFLLLRGFFERICRPYSSEHAAKVLRDHGVNAEEVVNERCCIGEHAHKAWRVLERERKGARRTLLQILAFLILPECDTTHAVQCEYEKELRAAATEFNQLARSTATDCHPHTRGIAVDLPEVELPSVVDRYAVKIWEHGDLKDVARVHRLSDLYNKLGRWESVLRKISSALKHIMSEKAVGTTVLSTRLRAVQSVVAAFEELALEMFARYKGTSY